MYEIQKSLKLHSPPPSSKFIEFRSLKSLVLLLPFKTDLHSGPHDHHAKKRALLMKHGGSVATRTSIILFTCH